MCAAKKIKNIFLPKEAKIIKTKQLTENVKYFSLKLAKNKTFKFNPGQILEVSLFGFGEIPIGLASSPTKKDHFDIVVRTVGRVSTALNNLKDNDILYIRGPLGNGFNLEKLYNQNVLIVAGGLGICPTRSLIDYILDKRTKFKEFTLFYGAKEPKLQLFKDDIKTWKKSSDINYFETVDHIGDHTGNHTSNHAGNKNWKSNIGVITTLFKHAKIEANTKVIICGPPIMFKFVILELEKIGVPKQNIFLDLERRMKCGIGKCGHCQINDKYVCVDGPVFSYDELENLEEAM